MAGKSTLNRFELTRQTLDPANRYRKIVHHADKIEDLFVTLFLQGHVKEPDELTLDFDATDDPLHGGQEGRFFHGYYGQYCYLPLYVFCGDHLLVAQLRTADRDASDGAKQVLARLA